MKNLYDDQEFWIGRVAQAKREGNPWASIFSEREYDIKKNRVEVLSNYVNLDTSRVLDAGCAYGWLSGYVKNYTGLDQTVALINYGKELHPNANLVIGKMQEMPFENDQFDVVICSCVKHGIVECEQNGMIEAGRWKKIEDEFMRVAKLAIIWPSYSNQYEIVQRAV